MNIYTAELSFIDEENVIIGIWNGNERRTLTSFSELMELEGIVYFKFLKLLRNYFFREMGRLKMHRVSGKKALQNQYNMLEKDKEVYFIKFHKLKFLSLDKVMGLHELDKEIEDLHKLVVKLREFGLTGSTYSSSAFNKMRAAAPLWYQMYNDERYFKKKGVQELEDWPLLDKAILKESGPIRRSARGALCMTASTEPYEGASITGDINSMYTWIMNTKILPKDRPRRRTPKEYVEFLHKMAPGGRTMYLLTVDIMMTAEKLAFFGFRENHFDKNEKLKYPKEVTGRFTMWSFALDQLFELYNVSYCKLVDVLEYRSSKCPAASYLEEIFEKKRLAESPEERLAYKLMLNGITGKPGQKNVFIIDELETHDYQEPLEIERAENYKDRSIALNSAIYEYARVELVNAIYAAGVENFLYCDTDSITIKGDTWPIWLKVGDGLGEWKIESKNTYFHAIGQKQYIKEGTDNKVTLGGFSGDTSKVTRDDFLNGATLLNIKWNTDGIIPYQVEEPMTIRCGAEFLPAWDKIDHRAAKLEVIDRRLADGAEI